MVEALSGIVSLFWLVGIAVIAVVLVSIGVHAAGRRRKGDGE